VLEVIGETTRKVLVFVPFTHTIELLQKRWRRRRSHATVINGKVNLNKRSQIVERLPDANLTRVCLSSNPRQPVTDLR
jgi:superfamily II DNA/RNA helicase